MFFIYLNGSSYSFFLMLVEPRKELTETIESATAKRLTLKGIMFTSMLKKCFSWYSFDFFFI